MTTKRCPRCSKTKCTTNFYKNAARTDGFGTYCKLCEAAVSDPYRKSPEGKRKARERARKRRLSLIEQMGGECVCCGEDTYEFLQFDHIDGNGAEHRNELGRTSLATSDVIAKIEEFQLLCCNCNFAKGMYGGCPHEDARCAIMYLESSHLQE